MDNAMKYPKMSINLSCEVWTIVVFSTRLNGVNYFKKMENSLPALCNSSVHDFIISEWVKIDSKPLFTTPDVRKLVCNISCAVESMINLKQEIQGPNYAIVGARGWLMQNINILLNRYFEQKKLKARSFYRDMSVSEELPFDTMQKWLNTQGSTLDYSTYDDWFAWFRAVREEGFRLFYFVDEIHNVYELTDKEFSKIIIKQLYVIGKSTCSLGFISSSSYKWTKYAFSDIPDYPNFMKLPVPTIMDWMDLL
eukprot:NODE_481_length_6950_cov_0.533353.p4 type:complete len:252 gc:universal NODE_481_length_6950_cov_0.533353:5560-6315(+)